jgi:hypothetical protein
LVTFSPIFFTYHGLIVLLDFRFLWYEISCPKEKFRDKNVYPWLPDPDAEVREASGRRHQARNPDRPFGKKGVKVVGSALKETAAIIFLFGSMWLVMFQSGRKCLKGNSRYYFSVRINVVSNVSKW